MPKGPVSVRLNSGLPCPAIGCGKRLMRETKDKNSKRLGQLRCDSCGYIADLGTYRTKHPSK